MGRPESTRSRLLGGGRYTGVERVVRDPKEGANGQSVVLDRHTSNLSGKRLTPKLDNLKEEGTQRTSLGNG